MAKSKRELRLEDQIGGFIRQYTRKRQGGRDPNDRHYSRKVERIVKRMKPDELDDLMNGNDAADDDNQ